MEVAMTSLALWWGIILLLPYHTFPTSIAYQAMAGIANETVWGLFMLLIGSAQLLGTIHNNYQLKRVSLLAATGVWFFIASMFGISELFTTATGTYFIIGCLTGWLHMKVGAQNGR
ncbi:hypothetical protein [Peribacillus frigoritolerans]|uniref:SPW repeat-containing protein n=1 Tax=Peribacillus castrilensis TaxID=2897690 RepID=A0AAW9NL28_9BACI|nr:hypothetical protein [Peribacillus castrilensis]